MHFSTLCRLHICLIISGNPMPISAGNLQILFSDAYQWLWRGRKRHPPSSDIWSFRCDCKHQAHKVTDRFVRGRHQFTVQQKVTLAQGDTIALWSSLDVWGGTYRDIQRGIPRGASLSPLLGAFYLLDMEMEKLDVKYFRYMDDILILASTRWKLRRAIRVLNQTFNALHLEQHPDKTLIGRTEQGFDFLGYHFGPEGLAIAHKTLNNFVERAIRLYEQDPPVLKARRLGEYVKRWRAWAHGGVNTKDLGHTPCTPCIK